MSPIPKLSIQLQAKTVVALAFGALILIGYSLYITIDTRPVYAICLVTFAIFLSGLILSLNVDRGSPLKFSKIALTGISLFRCLEPLVAIVTIFTIIFLMYFLPIFVGTHFLNQLIIHSPDRWASGAGLLLVLLAVSQTCSNLKKIEDLLPYIHPTYLDLCAVAFSYKFLAFPASLLLLFGNIASGNPEGFLRSLSDILRLKGSYISFEPKINEFSTKYGQALVETGVAHFFNDSNLMSKAE